MDPSQTDLPEEGSFNYEGQDISNHPPKAHLQGVLGLWNNDGSRNLVDTVETPTINQIPPTSNNTSQASTDDAANDHQATRDPTPNTEITSPDESENDSTAGATHSVTTHGDSSYTQSDDKVEHVWYRDGESVQ
ncbi:hypothetical protein E2P81_ATG09325 [Venturia nashicola]|uniref:Uncharacterized protein n=1 Tax=Venturia nashicola TaxID=86259 RepID=A0A4Z1P4K8_9PEZI|nr:hypothetical protein E6O75_ATG09532 [Venturia nashicola]TLD25668.1 hypothetical protein E2P81_ATG09325 [Venturia nashicola]